MKKTCGIYKITNLLNEKVYIGQSTYIERRFSQHKSPYEWSRHPSNELYGDMNTMGIKNFSFEIIEECPLELLEEKEIYWTKYYNAVETGYNKVYGTPIGSENDKGERHPNHKLTEQDVIDIRTRYNNKERCKEVETLYSNKIGHSGFSKVWKGETWTHIMMEVYTPENKNFHLHNTGQNGSQNGRSKLTEEDVYAIRMRKKNRETWQEVYKDYQYTEITEGSFKNVWYNRNWKNIIV